MGEYITNNAVQKFTHTMQNETKTQFVLGLTHITTRLRLFIRPSLPTIWMRKRKRVTIRNRARHLRRAKSGSFQQSRRAASTAGDGLTTDSV
jgi:hypothetical protein